MATILVVDDVAANREFLMTLLGYRDHRLIEAADGSEALTLARVEHPDLIISDILMPTMDGYEFVQQLRADRAIAKTPVIFSTADFLEREATALADRCGVSYVLSKPCEPEDVLRTVETALGLREIPPAPPEFADFDREHLRLLANTLEQKVEELKAVNQKMSVLIEVGHQLASEHHPLLLLEEYCRAARSIIGANSANVGVLNEDEQTLGHFYVCGAGENLLGYGPSPDKMPGNLLQEYRPCRLSHLDGDPRLVGLPAGFPPVYSLLGVPITFQARVYGWLCLTNKLGADEFSEEDEDLAYTLAAQMAVAYENALLYTEVQDYNSELRIEVAEGKRVEEDRARLLASEQEARRKAEDLNQAKDLFLTTISHELREPLTAILGWARILRTEESDPATLSYAIETIERNIDVQVRLIEDLMDTSRIENGKLRLDFQPVDLGPVVQAAVDVVRPAAEEKGVQLLLTLNSSPTEVTGDPARLQQVVWNLLSNAIKFTAVGGSVAVRVEPVDGKAAILIQDTGRGVSSELLPHIFERFIQGDEPGTRRKAGLGIGLSLVHKLVSLHGGTVSAESPGEGQGMAFNVTLPLNGAGAAAYSAIASDQEARKKPRSRQSRKRAAR
jgi:signal transduction histidine kinase/CheY-like chemotaxis protein